MKNNIWLFVAVAVLGVSHVCTVFMTSSQVRQLIDNQRGFLELHNNTKKIIDGNSERSIENLKRSRHNEWGISINERLIKSIVELVCPDALPEPKTNPVDMTGV